MKIKNERNAGMPDSDERKKREKMAKQIKVLMGVDCSKNVMIQHVQEKMGYSYQQAQRLVLKVSKGEF